MKRLLKIVISAALLLTASIGYSQNARSKTFVPQHEIRVGVGTLSIPVNPDYYWEGNDTQWRDNYFNNPGGNYENDLNYRGATFITGAISASYTYSLNRMIDVGATFTYLGRYNNIYNRFTDLTTGHRRDHNMFLTPMLRVNWLKLSCFRIYSQLGVGLGALIIDEKNSPINHPSPQYRFSGQLTLLGFTLGKDLFMFGEILGLGNQGFASAGVGYRFNAKKR